MAAGEPASFPLLSVEQVIDNCKELFRLHISEEELRKPTSQFVRKFYLDAVTTIMQKTPEMLTQPPFNLLSELRYPEIFEDGAPLVYFSILLQRFMHACLVPDFALVTDLMKPTLEHGRLVSSAIINFQKFKVSQDHHYDAAMVERETLFEQKKHLLARNEELKKKIGQIKEARAEEEDKFQQILSEADNLERVVHELNRQQASDFKEIQQLKSVIAERTSKEAEIKVTKTNDVEECERLKAQIVTSPDKFRGEITRLNGALDSCRTTIAEQSQKLQGLKNQVDSMNILEENALQAVKLIASIEDETQKLRDLMHKVQDMHDACACDDEALRERAAKLQNLKRHDASQMDKMARLETKNEKKTLSIKFAIDQAEKNREESQANAKSYQADVLEMEKTCQELYQKLEEREANHAVNMEKMKQGYQDLLAGLDTYHASLKNGWQQLAQSLA